MKSKYPIIFIIATFMFLNGCAKKHAQKPKADNISNVSVVKIGLEKLQPKLTLSGWVEPYLDIRISSELGGEVEEVLFKEGMAVKRGDMLAKVNLSFLDTSLVQAKTSFELAKAKCERQKQLFEKKLISQQQMDEFTSSLTVAEANYEFAKVKYEKGKIISPVDGILNSLDIDEGEILMPGQNIGRVVNVDKVYIFVSFPEKDILKIKTNDKVKIKSSSFSERIEGEINYISLAALKVSKTFRVKVMTLNKNKMLRPGMIVTVEFDLPPILSAISIPQTALIQSKGRKSVFIAENGKAFEKEVETGLISGNDIQITNGLYEKDSIIVFGYQNLIDGDSVKVTDVNTEKGK